MEKHEIEIEGLPGGMIAHSVKVIELDSGDSEQCTYNAQVIAKRVKPRRIVLEETDEVRLVSPGEHYGYVEDKIYIGMWPAPNCSLRSYRIWREVNESDLSLNNDEHKLSLSIDECREIEHYYLSWNVKKKGLINKITEFLKDK